MGPQENTFLKFFINGKSTQKMNFKDPKLARLSWLKFLDEGTKTSESNGTANLNGDIVEVNINSMGEISLIPLVEHVKNYK